MAIRIVRLGSPRGRDEGLRLGTVRRPPRGVEKEDTARLDYYDLWLPELAPSAELMAWVHAAPFTAKRWTAFATRHRREMSAPAAARLLALLAALSRRTPLAVGCSCEDAAHCHRSLLAELLAEGGAPVETA